MVQSQNSKGNWLEIGKQYNRCWIWDWIFKQRKRNTVN
jgi:hypothetical protein